MTPNITPEALERALDALDDAILAHNKIQGHGSVHWINYTRDQRLHVVHAALAATLPELLAAQPASSIDVEAMLKSCVPSGDIVDPQLVADNIRRWCAVRKPASSAVGHEPKAWLIHWTPVSFAKPEITTDAARVAGIQALGHAPDIEPLYTAPPAPVAGEAAEMSPEFTDTARAAIAWVLWHHQGGSSAVGRPLRYALGMGDHEPLNDQRIVEAKRYASLVGAKTEDFKQPAPAAVLVAWWLHGGTAFRDDFVTDEKTAKYWHENRRDGTILTPLYDRSQPAAQGVDLGPLRILVEAVEAEFCGEHTEELEPDDSKVAYPEERCHITFGMIRNARRVIDSQQHQQKESGA